MVGENGAGGFFQFVITLIASLPIFLLLLGLFILLRWKINGWRLLIAFFMVSFLIDGGSIINITWKKWKYFLNN